MAAKSVMLRRTHQLFSSSHPRKPPPPTPSLAPMSGGRVRVESVEALREGGRREEGCEDGE